MNLKELKKRMEDRTFFEKHIKYLPIRTLGRIEDVIRSIKHAWQRVFRGYDDTAYWDLGDYLAEIALPILKNYRNGGLRGIPIWKEGDTEKQAQKEWNDKLDKMIVAFDLLIKEDSFADDWKENHKKIQEGLKEFAENYQSLWD